MADVVWHNVLGAVLLKELISYLGYESRPMVASVQLVHFGILMRLSSGHT